MLTIPASREPCLIRVLLVRCPDSVQQRTHSPSRSSATTSRSDASLSPGMPPGSLLVSGLGDDPRAGSPTEDGRCTDKAVDGFPLWRRGTVSSAGHLPRTPRTRPNCCCASHAARRRGTRLGGAGQNLWEGSRITWTAKRELVSSALSKKEAGVQPVRGA